jgi:uncharacterized protein DUF3522
MRISRSLKTIASVLTGPQVLTGIFLLVSNLAFLPAILLAAEKRLITEIFLFVVTMTTSIVYHLCQANFYCIASFNALQTSDHFFVYSTLIWVVLFFVEMPMAYRTGVFILLQAFLLPSIIILVSNSWYVALVLIGVLIVIAFYAVMIYLHGLPNFYEPDVITSVVLLGAGIGFHIAAGSPSLNAQYGIFHGFWHIFAMLSIFYVMRSKFRRPKWMKFMMSSFLSTLRAFFWAKPITPQDLFREGMIEKV